MLLQTILIGQPELRELLRLQSMRQFAQRIAIDQHLDPLLAPETVAYVHHRLRVAGGSTDLFSTAAIDRIHEATGGVPRLVNQICDNALVYGFAEQVPAIDVDLVEQVIQERATGGLLPLRMVRQAQVASSTAAT
jgi:type II secretory pathway predicted ATPase ExeA